MTRDPERWRRLEQVCQGALERPLQERADFLRQACDGDETLRRDAESLLERDADAAGFLSTPLASLAADAMMYSPGGRRCSTRRTI